MSDLLVFIILYAVQAATICFLFVMLFIRGFRRWWLRAATLVFGLGALALPAYMATKTLGYPDPWPEPGLYNVYGWDIDEAEGAFYLFVTRPDDTTPIHLRVPFELRTALKLQKAAAEPGIYKQITVDIRPETDEHGRQYDYFIERVFADEPEE